MMATIDLLDDDDDDAVILVENTGAKSTTKATAAATATSAAAVVAIVDLTTATTSFSSYVHHDNSYNNRTQHATTTITPSNTNEDEVQCVGVSQRRRKKQRRSHDHNNNNSSSMNNGIQFLGTTRSMGTAGTGYPNYNYNNNNNNNNNLIMPARNNIGHSPQGMLAVASSPFVRQTNALLQQYQQQYQYQEQRQQNRVPASSSTTTTTKKTKNTQKGSSSRMKASPPPPKSIEKGKAKTMVPTGFDALALYYPHLKATERTMVLYGLVVVVPPTPMLTKTHQPQQQHHKTFWMTKKAVHDWRVQYEKDNSNKVPLWSMVSSFADAIIQKSSSHSSSSSGSNDGDTKMPAKPTKTTQKQQQHNAYGDHMNKNDIVSCIWDTMRNNTNTDNGSECSIPSMVPGKGIENGNRNNSAQQMEVPPSASRTPASISDRSFVPTNSVGGTAAAAKHDTSIANDANVSTTTYDSIGPLGPAILASLHTYFRAYVTRNKHKAILDRIEPIDDDKIMKGGGGGDVGITCSICSDTYDLSNTVPCSGEPEIHFFCKSCFHSYVTVTVESGPIGSVCCPLPDCKSLFSVYDTKSNLSLWDALMIDHRETNRDRRVALAAECVLHCECGAVAIITKEDIGNGRIQCPGCHKRYCCKCGNDDHGDTLCPPPAETLQWLDKHSKECPNCKNRIEKNGGCDHMTCNVSAGGCGHQFWWSCLCPYSGHKPGCDRIGERRL